MNYDYEYNCCCCYNNTILPLSITNFSKTYLSPSHPLSYNKVTTTQPREELKSKEKDATILKKRERGTRPCL